jgi:hypothetical protein
VSKRAGSKYQNKEGGVMWPRKKVKRAASASVLRKIDKCQMASIVMPYADYA